MIKQKVELQDSVMEGATSRRIDTKNLGATGSFKEINDEVFGKLLL
jgi:hypothetical protein